MQPDHHFFEPEMKIQAKDSEYFILFKMEEAQGLKIRGGLDIVRCFTIGNQ